MTHVSFLGTAVLALFSPTILSAEYLDLTTEIFALGTPYTHPLDRRIEINPDRFRIDLVESESTLVNLGSPYSGVPFDLVIPLKNDSASKIIITELQSSCGCLVGKTLASALEAGQESKLLLQVHPPNQDESFKRRITVRYTTVDSEQRVHYINFAGKAKRMIGVLQEYIDISGIDDFDADYRDVLIIRNFPGFDMRNVSVQISGPLIASQEVVDRSERMQTIRLKFSDFTDVPFDQCEATITARTADGKDFSNVFTISVRDILTFRPRKLGFDSTRLPESRRIVIVRNPTSVEEDAASVAIDDAYLVVDGHRLVDEVEVQQSVSTSRVGTFTILIPKLPQGFDDGSKETILRVKVAGEAKILNIPLVISKSDDSERH